MVAVSVLHELLPFSRHFAGCCHKVVLGPEIVPVVGAVDAPHIVQKAFEGLSITVLIEHGRERLVELVERFYAREHVVGLPEAVAHASGHLHLLERGVQNGGVRVDESLRFRALEYGYVQACPLLAVECFHHVVEHAGNLLLHLLIHAFGECGLMVFDERGVPLMQPHIVSGAQSKKGRAFRVFFLPFSCWFSSSSPSCLSSDCGMTAVGCRRSPTGMEYFSAKYSGATS